jgi:hypothetical protein
MWSDKKSWWQRKATDNQTDNAVRKNWCVIRVAVGFRHLPNQWEPVYTFRYKAVGKGNAPKIYTADGRLMQQVEVDNLTKQEAYEVAKGLNFLDGETNAT